MIRAYESQWFPFIRSARKNPDFWGGGCTWGGKGRLRLAVMYFSTNLATFFVKAEPVKDGRLDRWGNSETRDTQRSLGVFDQISPPKNGEKLTKEKMTANNKSNIPETKKWLNWVFLRNWEGDDINILLWGDDTNCFPACFLDRNGGRMVGWIESPPFAGGKKCVCLFVCLFVWLVGWLVCWLFVWLVVWLVTVFLCLFGCWLLVGWKARRGWFQFVENFRCLKSLISPTALWLEKKPEV